MKKYIVEVPIYAESKEHARDSICLFSDLWGEIKVKRVHDKPAEPAHVMLRVEGEEPPAPPVIVTDWERLCRYVADNLDGMDVYKVAGLFIEMEDRLTALEKRVNELSNNS
ncbi:MAG TPA: hypothetical protein PLL41_08230 [Smithella sp.]|nr:hypothetical protein [Smithella sp.]